MSYRGRMRMLEHRKLVPVRDPRELEIEGPDVGADGSETAALSEQFKALVKRLGFRPDFTGPNGERVPFLSVHDAIEISDHLRDVSSVSTLAALNIPVDAIPATRMLKNRALMAARAETPVFHEAPPPLIGAKILPDVSILQGPETFEFFQAAGSLAMDVDILKKIPTHLDLGWEAAKETAEDFAKAGTSALDALVRGLEVAAVAVVGLIALVFGARVIGARGKHG